MIAEAEKAAKALEVAAGWSPLAQASLVETRKLIAEAIQSVKSIETGEGNCDENDQNIHCISTQSVNYVEEIDVAFEGLILQDQVKVNGAGGLASNKASSSHLGFEKFKLQDLMNHDTGNSPTSSCDGSIGLSRLTTGHANEPSGLADQVDQFLPNGICRHENVASNGAKAQSVEEGITATSIHINKKWVRGKLVEVVEED